MSNITNVPAILERVMQKKKLTRHGWGSALTPPKPTRVSDIMHGKQKSVTLQALDELAIAAGYRNFIAMAVDVQTDGAPVRETC